MLSNLLGSESAESWWLGMCIVGDVPYRVFYLSLGWAVEYFREDSKLDTMAEALQTRMNGCPTGI